MGRYSSQDEPHNTHRNNASPIVEALKLKDFSNDQITISVCLNLIKFTSVNISTTKLPSVEHFVAESIVRTLFQTSAETLDSSLASP